MEDRQGVDHKTPGIVFCTGNGGEGLYRTRGLYSDPGSGLLSIPGSDESNDRKVAANILIRKEDGSYAIDFEDFERQIVEKGVKLFLFCSPHNPVSRVWTKGRSGAFGRHLPKASGDHCK